MAQADEHAPLPDADARRCCVTAFDRPLLLEAGAGTGKTATLVARILAWCLGPGWEAAAGEEPDGSDEDRAVAVLRGVAAITFTEAAAAEMATRVGQALARVQRVTGGAPEGVELPVGLPLDVLPDAPTLHTRARALRAALDHLDVGTIHAFCRRIIAAHPLEVGIAPDFEVDASGSRLVVLVREVLEADLREAWADPLDEDLLLLAKRRIAPPDLEKALLDLVDRGARAEDFGRDPFDVETCSALVGALSDTAGPFHELGARLLAGAGRSPKTGEVLSAVQATVQALAEPVDDAGAELDRLAGALARTWDDRLLDKLKDWRKGRPNVTEKKLLGSEADAFLELARAFLEALQPLLQIDRLLLGAARRVVHRVLARVESELRRRGVATFTDLLRDARTLLTAHPEIAGRQRGRLRQLLVDEFQDTDELQCAVVQALAFDGDDGEPGPCLFLVGDPKQSIFAWRNADLVAYDGFKERVRTAGGDVLELTCNFRSVPAVLDEVERAVAPVMEELRGVQPAFVPLVAHRSAPADSGPAVEHWVSWPRDPVSGAIEARRAQRRGPSYDVEARAIARDLVRLSGEGVAWKEMALIFRALTEIEPYLALLREHGVPYEVQSERNYYRRREVVDATALVRAVLDPEDLLALVTLLRSPMVGLPDAALLPLWEARFPDRVVRLRWPREELLAELDEIVHAAAARVPASVPGIEGIRGWETSVLAALRALAEARDAFGREPVDVWIARLRALFLPDAVEAARFLGAYRLANLERFFRELARTLEERGGDVQSVLRTLRASLDRDDKTEASRPADSAQDAVQVLTIHGAKGLEFGHVYLPQMHKDDRKGGGGETTTFDRRGGTTGYRLFGAASPGIFVTDVLREEAEAAERVRLLYVATTRAKDRLVLASAWRTEPKKKEWRACSLAADLLERREASDAAVLALAARAREESDEPVVDAGGALWRLPVLAGEALFDADAGEAAALVSPAEVAADARLLGERRAAAAAHRARPFATTASAESHATAAQHEAEGRFAEGEAGAGGARAPGIGRDAAMAAGTLVHRALELLDLAGDADAERERVAAGLADPDPAIEARARELLDRCAANGLLERLFGLADRVVARELPVLLPPGAAADDPVGFVAGAVDLVHRDPQTDALVVVDYKTDLVESDAELEERAAGYRSQGAAYVRAVQEALALPEPPRFELWFLHAGRVVAS
jgi:ATP-dependent helicase/nuclease subunit A